MTPSQQPFASQTAAADPSRDLQNRIEKGRPRRLKLDRRLMLSLLSVLIYFLAYAVISYTTHYGMGIAATIPVMVIAWFFGSFAGVCAGLLTLPFNIFMGSLFGIAWFERMFVSGGAVPGTLGNVLIGGVIGHISALSRMLEAQHDSMDAANRRLKEEIRQRDLADGELQQVKQQLENILETSPEPVVVVDEHGIITRVNRALLEMIDRRPEELVGKSTLSLSPTEQGEYESLSGESVQIGGDFFVTGRQIMDRLFKHGKISNRQTYFIRRDRKLVPIEENLVVLKDRDGNITGAFGILRNITDPIRDITERIRAEAELKNNQERLQELVNIKTAELTAANALLLKSRAILNDAQSIAHIGSWERDFRTGKTYWSDEMFRLMGYVPGEIEPSYEGFFSHLDTDDRDRLMGLQQETRPMPDEVENNYRLITRQGAVRTIHTRTRFEMDESGSLARMHGIIQDVSQRRETEQAMKESEERYRLLAENVADVIWTTDMDLNIVYISQSVTRLLGFTPEEIIDSPPQNLLTPESYEKAFQAYNRMLQEPSPDSEPPQIFALEHLRKDGSSVWTETRTVLMRDRDGRVTGLLGVTRDTSDRYRAEREKDAIQAQLLQAQKMEAIGVLAGGVAHDFNNLLTTIQGYVDLAIMQADKSDPVLMKLRPVQQAAIRASDLTRQLLLFSRKQPMQQSLFNLNSIIENMLKMLGRIISENITISTDLDSGLWSVQADAGNMEQVIMNLAVNARDAMPSGGSICIKTENRTVPEGDCRGIPDAQPGDCIVMTLSDSGTGMDQSTLDHVFEPFYTTKEAGTGLGLAVVYGIVTHHGGWVQAQSRPGKGTSFRIFLPAVKTQAAQTTRHLASLEGLQGAGQRILLVEDQKEVIEFCSKALRSNGYRVSAALSVQDALALFDKEQGNFDLLLSDVVLPDRTGIDLAVNILARKPGLGILLSSGYTDEKSQWSVITEKKWPYLQKPYSVAALLTKVKEALYKKG